jgi:hypothetical protein
MPVKTPIRGLALSCREGTASRASDSLYTNATVAPGGQAAGLSLIDSRKPCTGPCHR